VRSARTWSEPDVAQQHTALALTQLEDPESCYPFRIFRAAVSSTVSDVPSTASFLELGCGAGHYGELLDRWFPGRFVYTGSDMSEAMIAEARRLWPERRFVVDDIYRSQLGLDDFDVVCASGLIDVLRDYRPPLKRILASRAPVVILHRQSLTDGPSVVTEADAYGYPTWRVDLGRKELGELAAATDRTVETDCHEPGETYHSLVLPRR
jgi:SAM-dependent methyltransferase